MSSQRSERRSAQRVACLLSATLDVLPREPGGALVTLPAVVHNLSTSGARVHLGQDLALGTAVQLRLEFPEVPGTDLGARRWQSAARVVWLLEEREADGRPIGLEFPELSAKDEAELALRIKALRRA